MAEEDRSFFGFRFKTKKSKKSEKELRSFIVPGIDDGASDIGVGGYFGATVQENDLAATENGLIHQYRTIAKIAEVDQAIEDIISESIISDDMTGQSVKLSLSDSDYSDQLKDILVEEFEKVLKLLNFNANGHDIFRNWYIDGRLYYHKIIDMGSPKKGILELRPINPTEIKKVREVEKETDPKSGVEVIKSIEEYFVYTPTDGFNFAAVKVLKDAITYVTSGLIDRTDGIVLSYLHKSIRPANQLKMTENAQVIYRLTRAPERRIFYIDVGNMPKSKAEQYLKDIMNRYRHKMVYDASSGELTNDSDKMSMLEDFWLPRREGGKGTEITTLPGGDNLSAIDDIIYFQKKLFRSLNVPISRLDPEAGYSFGSGSEITRDEVKFAKHISKLRRKFSDMFDDILRTQLMLKGYIKDSEWNELKEHITYDFIEDNHYAEIKDSEMLMARLNLLRDMGDYVGKYFSHEYIRRHVLKQDDVEVKDINAQMKAEKNDPLYANSEEDEDRY